MKTDTAYLERVNGQWEAWTYSDGQRIYLRKSHDQYLIMQWLYDRCFRIISVR